MVELVMKKELLIPHPPSLFKSVQGLLKTEARVYAKGIFRRRINKEILWRFDINMGIQGPIEVGHHHVQQLGVQSVLNGHAKKVMESPRVHD